MYGSFSLSLRHEYSRLGINRIPTLRLTSINSSHQFSPTYPSVLVLPTSISDEQLYRVADFRSRKRIPAISWVGKITTTSNQVVLLRSSQPSVGMLGARCEEDEHLLQSFCSAVQCNKLRIIDARPSANAISQCALGGGYENHLNYVGNGCKECTLEFIG